MLNEDTNDIETLQSLLEFDYNMAAIDLQKSGGKNVKSYRLINFLRKLQANINKKNLYTSKGIGGYEKNFHITLAFGDENLHQNVSQFIEASNYKNANIPFIIKDIRKFEMNHYDVIYIAVESNQLEMLHKALLNKSNSFTFHKRFIPHITLAYVKKGTEDKILGNHLYNGYTLYTNKILISQKDNRDFYITLAGRNE